MDTNELNNLTTALSIAGYQIHEISVESRPCGKLDDGKDEPFKGEDIRLRISPKHPGIPAFHFKTGDENRYTPPKAEIPNAEIRRAVLAYVNSEAVKEVVAGLVAEAVEATVTDEVLTEVAKGIAGALAKATSETLGKGGNL